ncbi:MAG: DUF4349 domain-containing protein [Streptosporangiaceae bacterium]|jgi:hypothetical protein|nr:hypothetical protein [Actinomycetota bacterium]
MSTIARSRPFRGSLRTTLIIAAAISGTGLLLAGCSQGDTARSGASSASSAQPGAAGERAPLALPAASGAVGAAAGATAALNLTSQSIVYTASLTVRAASVAAAASHAAGIVSAAGGYTAGEQESARPGQAALSVASLELKIPVASYAVTLGRLAALGTQLALSQQAADVTEQVADVASRVTSAQAAITQLRALLRQAGSVGALLAVQDQINVQESALESLLAQQRALAHETTYGTVSLTLVSRPEAARHARKKASHGFAAGLAGGWRALRAAVTWLLTALGAVLPFAVLAVLAGGIGYGWRRRVLRRRSPPPAAA